MRQGGYHVTDHTRVLAPGPQFSLPTAAIREEVLPIAAERFLALEQSGQYREQLRLLSDHRRQLLDCLHQEERRIDCLDYLVYKLEKRRAGDP